MTLKKSLAITLFLVFAPACFAADMAAKEDTTPPPAEGALTLDQIQPITTIGKPATAAPAPTTAPQMGTPPAATAPQQTSMNMPEDLMVSN